MQRELFTFPCSNMSISCVFTCPSNPGSPSNPGRRGKHSVENSSSLSSTLNVIYMIKKSLSGSEMVLIIRLQSLERCRDHQFHALSITVSRHNR